jgi:hypothetical protein
MLLCLRSPQTCCTASLLDLVGFSTYRQTCETQPSALCPLTSWRPAPVAPLRCAIRWPAPASQPRTPAAAPRGGARAPTDLPPEPTAQRPPHEMLFSCCRMSCVASAAVPSGMCARWSYLRAPSPDRVRAAGLGPPSGVLSRIFLCLRGRHMASRGGLARQSCSPPLHQQCCTARQKPRPRKTAC